MGVCAGWIWEFCENWAGWVCESLGGPWGIAGEVPALCCVWTGVWASVWSDGEDAWIGMVAGLDTGNVDVWSDVEGMDVLS